MAWPKRCAVFKRLMLMFEFFSHCINWAVSHGLLRWKQSSQSYVDELSVDSVDHKQSKKKFTSYIFDSTTPVHHLCKTVSTSTITINHQQSSTTPVRLWPQCVEPSLPRRRRRRGLRSPEDGSDLRKDVSELWGEAIFIMIPNFSATIIFTDTMTSFSRQNNFMPKPKVLRPGYLET